MSQNRKPTNMARVHMVTMKVVFMKRRWYSAQKEGRDGRWYWEWEVEDIPVYTTTVRTDADGQAEALFTPEVGGAYKVRASARDSRENEIRSATYFWISSAEWISWRRESNDRLELIVSRKYMEVTEGRFEVPTSAPESDSQTFEADSSCGSRYPATDGFAGPPCGTLR